MDIVKVLVVGGGTMGRDIAIVTADAGFDVKISDISAEAAEKAIKSIETRLDKRIEKKEISAENKRAILAGIRPAVIEDAKDADLVIEAVVEDM
jgi:3-hydroxybutyryl-CoA dehydrogenase